MDQSTFPLSFIFNFDHFLTIQHFSCTTQLSVALRGRTKVRVHKHFEKENKMKRNQIAMKYTSLLMYRTNNT